VLLASFLGGCASLDVQREPSQALPANDSAFGRSIQAQAAPHQGRPAFACSRTAPKPSCARRADPQRATSLDLQYYIVHDGISTRMLVDELLKAADRGVRVRILLDDTTSDGLDTSSPPWRRIRRSRFACSTRCTWAAAPA
jgi:putative cardiolipin synthase